MSAIYKFFINAHKAGCSMQHAKTCTFREKIFYLFRGIPGALMLQVMNSPLQHFVLCCRLPCPIHFRVLCGNGWDTNEFLVFTFQKTL
jgi:hypothetical protein